MASEHTRFVTDRRRLSEVPEEDADATDEHTTPLALLGASRLGAPHHASQQPSEGSINSLSDSEDGELQARLQLVEAEIPKIEAQLAEATAAFEDAERSTSNPSLVARDLLQVEMVLRAEKRKVSDLQQSQREAYELRSSLRALLTSGSSDQLDLEDENKEIKSGQSSGQLRVAHSSSKQGMENPDREDFPGFSPPAPVSLKRGLEEDAAPSAFSWSPRSAPGTASPTGISSNRGRFSPRVDSPGDSPRVSGQFTSSGASAHSNQDEVESPMMAGAEAGYPVTLRGTPYEDDPMLKELWQRMVEKVEKFQQQALSSVEQARLLEHQVQLIQADLDASMAREVETQSQVYYKEGLTNAMQMEMNSLRDEIAMLKHKLDKAEKDLAATQNQILQSAKGLRQDPGSPVSVQENEERVRQDEKARDERRIARMQTRVMELEEELRHAGSALECGAHEFKDKVMRLQQEKHQLEEESRNVRDANTQLQSRADQATANAAKLADELKAVQAKVVEVEQSNASLEDETGNLMERVEELLETNSQLAHTVSRAQKENQLLAHGLKKEKMEVVAQQEVVAEVRRAEERAVSERDAWVAAHQRLKEEHQEVDQNAGQLDDAMAAMEQKSFELQAAQEELAQAKRQIEDMEQQIVLMSEELENLVTSKLQEDAEEQNLVTKIWEQEADLREAYQQLQDEHSKLRQREQDIRATAAEAETKLAQVTCQAQEATAESSARIEELEHQIEVMAEEIEQQTQKLVSTGKEMVEAERMAIEQHETCQVVTRQLKESESNRKRSQTIAEEMEIQIDHLTEELHKSSGQVVSAGVSIMEKEAEVEAAQRQVQIAGQRLENSERQRRRTMSVAFSQAAEQAEAKRASVSAAPPTRSSDSTGRSSSGNPQLQALIISNQVKDEQLKELREKLAAKEAEVATEARSMHSREEVEAAREEVGRARREAEAAQQEVEALQEHLEQLRKHHQQEMETVREELQVHKQDNNSQVEIYHETGNGDIDDGEIRPYVDGEVRCITKSIPLWEELGDIHNEHELQQLVEVRDERDMARALWDAHQDRQHAQNLLLDYQRIIDIYRTEMAHLADEGR